MTSIGWLLQREDLSEYDEGIEHLGFFSHLNAATDFLEQYLMEEVEGLALTDRRRQSKREYINEAQGKVDRELAGVRRRLGGRHS